VAAIAHPLGNFSINHFARIQLEHDRIGIHYVVDMAEFHLAGLQVTDTDKDGTASRAELNAYPERVTPQYADGIVLTVDGIRVPLETVAESDNAAWSRRSPTLRDVTLQAQCLQLKHTPSTGF